MQNYFSAFKKKYKIFIVIKNITFVIKNITFVIKNITFITF